MGIRNAPPIDMEPILGDAEPLIPTPLTGADVELYGFRDDEGRICAEIDGLYINDALTLYGIHHFSWKFHALRSYIKSNNILRNSAIYPQYANIEQCLPYMRYIAGFQ